MGRHENCPVSNVVGSSGNISDYGAKGPGFEPTMTASIFSPFSFLLKTWFCSESSDQHPKFMPGSLRECGFRRQVMPGSR